MRAHVVQSVVHRRTFIVAGTLTLFAAFGLCLNELTVPVYRATVRIEFPRPRDRSPWTGQSVESRSYQSENQSLYTAAELITSRALLTRLVAGLSPEEREGILARHRGGEPAARIPGLVRAAGVTAAAALTTAIPDRSLPATDSDLEDLTLHALREIIRVEPVRDTRLVDLKVELDTPEGARIMADRLARLFVAYAAEKAVERDTSGLAFLELQTAEARDRLAPPAGDLAPGTAVSRAEVARLQETIGALGSASAAIRTERLAVGARLARLHAIASDESGAWIHEPIDGEAIGALRRAIVDCQMKLVAARAVLREKHPKRIALEEERASLRSRFRDELPRVIAALEGERSMLAAREAELRKALAQIERELGAADERVQRGIAIEAERNANQDLYARLLTRVQDRRIEARIEPPPAAIVDAATSEPDPVRPRKALNLAVCLMAGALAGIGVALLDPARKAGIRDPRALEEQLGLPVVAVVPGKVVAAS